MGEKVDAEFRSMVGKLVVRSGKNRKGCSSTGRREQDMKQGAVLE